MKRILSLLLCLILLVLCGCSSADKPYTPTGDALMAEDDQGPAPTAPRENTQDSLVMTYYPDQSMNPYLCTDFTNRALFSLLYQGLFSVDRSYQAEPMLCKQYSVSPDLRSYSFSLESATLRVTISGRGFRITSNACNPFRGFRPILFLRSAGILYE